MTAQPVYSSDQLIARAIESAKAGRLKTVAVAAAQDEAVIDAVAEAHRDGFLNGILIGNAREIEALALDHNIVVDKLEIIDEPDIQRAAHTAVKLAADGRADLIMKGFLPTSALLKVVLDKQYGLRGPNTLSHCAVLDIPGYHKLLNFTDGGMVVKPTPEQKAQIIENAVLAARALNLDPVKVAVSIVDGDLLSVVRSQLDRVIVEGPMSFEEALSSKLRDLPGANAVTGDADVYVADSIEECNVVAKSLINFTDTVFAGVIVGARVPVSLVSRTDSVKNKKASLAVACTIADFYQRQKIWEN